MDRGKASSMAHTASTAKRRAGGMASTSISFELMNLHQFYDTLEALIAIHTCMHMYIVSQNSCYSMKIDTSQLLPAYR